MAGQDRLRKGELYGAKINHSHVEGNIGSNYIQDFPQPLALDIRQMPVSWCVYSAPSGWQMSKIVKPSKRADSWKERVCVTGAGMPCI